MNLQNELIKATVDKEALDGIVEGRDKKIKLLDKFLI
jgi:hypothetical protein